ncbi:Protein of unknown function [Devosia lucknowensis]|uniref:DUF1344 domain-containing protein n=1 Tax=Devosia lucknowensis TaxID=1096929 RepID=A0A1Y6EYD5_9HYPH|nr:DUF1344 domain-containing protein [Devosia lucknowensis]SMQ66261.1 Protein of unknown function [Devosia lucknowensis]
MRKYLVPAFIALLAVAPAASFAATTAPTAAATTSAEQTMAGKVKFFNLEARSVELEDGSFYYLPPGFKAPDVKVGQQVTIHWKKNGSARDVTAIDIG